MIESLAYVHSLNVIHGDIKIQNYLRHTWDSEDGDECEVIKLCDFGLSIECNENGKALIPGPQGTFKYMAPEIDGNMILISKAVDIWAYGIVLYKLACAYFPTCVSRYCYGSGPIPFFP